MRSSLLILHDQLPALNDKSRRVVEDVLFDSISNFTSEHLVHSFTIDVDDPIHLAKYYDKMDLSQARKKWYELRNLAAPVYRGAIVEIDQQLSTFLGNQTKKRLSIEKSLPPATRGRSLTPIVEIRPVEIRDNLKSSDPDSPDGFTIIPRENENNWHS
ncbi:hypothetical protein GLOIN_2v1879617 [Rhizophagus irregularis DAOM 181602=DAOM 197198]|nr:hypothetical protein GLOIN_2v1879617 [Rhizophagus irregularis DAOM 181602=DAOM 197198]